MNGDTRILESDDLIHYLAEQRWRNSCWVIKAFATLHGEEESGGAVTHRVVEERLECRMIRWNTPPHRYPEFRIFIFDQRSTRACITT
jgi:hypothetical protein